MLYLAAAGLTVTLTAHRVLPLFDSIGPPPAYRWVRPPAAFADGNQSPAPGHVDITLTSGRSPSASVATDDGQLNANLGEGAIPTDTSTVAVAAAVAPIDPATVAPTPSELRPDGNAYLITLTYRPGGQPVGRLIGAANIVIAVPEPAQTILYSPDARSWLRQPAQAVGGSAFIGSTLAQPGYYLAASSTSVASSDGVARRTPNQLATATIAALVAALAAALALLPVATRRLRPRSPPGSETPANGPVDGASPLSGDQN